MLAERKLQLLNAIYRASSAPPSLGKADGAREIEQKSCPTSLPPDVAREEFSKIMSFDKLRDFMTCVVLGKMPSPLYAFADVDEENEDNDWWGGDAWKLLVEMNVRGLVTHESENNARPATPEVRKFQMDNDVSCRASVSGGDDTTVSTSSKPA